MKLLLRLFLIVALSGAASLGGPPLLQEEGGASQAASQEERSNPAALKVTVGSQAGNPGNNVVVPLYYTPPSGTEIRSLAVEIEWVSKNVKFVRSARGISAEAVGADVAAEITGTRTDDKSLEHSTLRVDASLVDRNPRRGLPEGLIAYLTFNVSVDAQPFSVEMRPKLISAESIGSPGRKITQAEIQNGKVTVEYPGMPTYVSCFFFTH